jgi:hypothetical protein
MSVVRFRARARLGGVICSEKWRVNRIGYHAGKLSNYGSAFQAQVTAYLNGFGGRPKFLYFKTVQF